MKKLVLGGVVAMAAMAIAADPVVTDVVAKQRFPWNGLVDITCNVSGFDGTARRHWFSVAALMPDSHEVREVSHFKVVRDGTNLTDYAVCANGDYRLLWDAQADLGTVFYSNMVVRVILVEHKKVQLWEGGPYWATTNIGAENPEDYGYYFWWGDTVGYKRENNKWVATDGSSSNFSFSSTNTLTYNKDIATLKGERWITADEVLAPEHDAAHVHWGGEWRIPTDAEFSALVSNCTTKWITTNGVYGRLITGKGTYADRSIFLPAAGYGGGSNRDAAGVHGYYWSSTPRSDPYRAQRLFVASGVFNRDNYNRLSGFPVRPVRGFTE